MARSHILVGIAASAVAMVAIASGVVLAADNTPSYGGCLKNGELTNITVSSRPARACERGAVQIAWNQTGPRGPVGPAGTPGKDGAAGAPGAEGDKGDPGTSVASLEALDGISCKGGTGTVKVTIDAAGSVSLTCNANSSSGGGTPQPGDYTAAFAPPSILVKSMTGAGTYRGDVTLTISAPQPTDTVFEINSISSLPLAVSGTQTIPAGQTSAVLHVTVDGNFTQYAELEAILPNATKASFTVAFACTVGSLACQ
jgi:hypothetical protein